MNAGGRAPIQRRERPTPSLASSDTTLGKCERAILQVLHNFPDGCEIGKIALLSNYRVSGGFRNSLSALRTIGGAAVRVRRV